MLDVWLAVTEHSRMEELVGKACMVVQSRQGSELSGWRFRRSAVHTPLNLPQGEIWDMVARGNAMRNVDAREVAVFRAVNDYYVPSMQVGNEDFGFSVRFTLKVDEDREEVRLEYAEAQLTYFTRGSCELLQWVHAGLRELVNHALRLVISRRRDGAHITEWWRPMVCLWIVLMSNQTILDIAGKAVYLSGYRL